MAVPGTRSPSPSLRSRQQHRTIGIIALATGVGAPAAYVLFSLIAYRHLPHPAVFSPVTNSTLSMLGNRYFNPHGAIFYRIGCIASGILTVGLFASLSPWKRSGGRMQNLSLVLMQLAGAAGGLGMIMNGLFPDEIHLLHYYSAGVVFIGLCIAIVLAFYALRRPARPATGLTVVGALATVTALVMFIFGTTHWLEWPPMALALVYMGLLGYYTCQIDGGG